MNIEIINPEPGPMGQIWKQYATIKYPSMIEGSEEWKERKKCFITGVWTALGIIQKTKDSLLPEFIRDITAECKSELGITDRKAIINRNGKA